MSRYIEVDSVMRELEREVELADDWKTAHEIANVVKYFPPADVRPNVHGEWISMKTNVYPACYTIRCSVCNFIAFYSGTEDNNKDCGYNFCPNCGADMRKGETNG